MLRIRSMNISLWSGDKSPVADANAWWRHQVETFSALLALCVGNSALTIEIPAQRAMTRSFDVIVMVYVFRRWVWH